MATRKVRILRFIEEVCRFICFTIEKGVHRKNELAVRILLDNEDVGCITNDGVVTLSSGGGHCVVIMLEQWEEIGAKAREFKEKCAIAQGESEAMNAQPVVAGDVVHCRFNADTYAMPCSKDGNEMP